MLTRCARWRYVTRTIQGSITIVRTSIASTAWWILSKIRRAREKPHCIQRIVPKFSHKNEDIEDTKVRCNFSWWCQYIPWNKSGCGLKPIISTIYCREVSIIRKVIMKSDNIHTP